MGNLFKKVDIEWNTRGEEKICCGTSQSAKYYAVSFHASRQKTDRL